MSGSGISDADRRAHTAIVDAEDAPSRYGERPITEVAVGVLVDPQGRFLLTSRPAGKVYAGFWEFPGGKVEAGETPESALIRELREELAIEVAGACLAPATFASHPLGDKHLVLLLYVCRKWGGTPRPLAASALRWVKPVAMHALEMPPADKPLPALLEALI